MKKTILITGGFGFLGRSIAHSSKLAGHVVIGIGNGRWDPAEARLHGFDEWLDARVTMSSLITLKQNFDVIVHCAGNGSVGYSVTNPLQDFNKTVESTAEILEYIRIKNPTALLVYPSSAGVYGAMADLPIKEEDALNPISPYGYHKRVAEQLCESYSRSYNLRIAIIRFFSIYGPGLTKQLLWDAAHKICAADTNVIFWGTGEETRDWIYIDDAVQLIFKATECKEKFTIINGANGVRVTVKLILDMLKVELKSKSVIEFNNQIKEGDPRFYHADISKSLNIKWKSSVTLGEGIHRYVAWYLENYATGNK